MGYRLLACMDGSAADERAFDLAQRLTPPDGRLDVLQVVPPIPVPLGAEATLAFDARSSAAGYLEQLRRMHPGTHGHNDVREGPAPDEILGGADDYGTSLIVVGDTDLAAGLVRRTYRPILVAAASRPSIGRILVPVDRSGRAACILEAVRPIARITRAEIVLLYVVPDVHDPMPQFQIDGPLLHSHDPAHRLQELADLIEADGLYAWPIVDHGNAVAAIRRQAHEVGADVIALATHGLTRLEHGMVKSVADAFLRTADRPLLLRRAGFHPERRDISWAQRCWPNSTCY